jgi:SAM-dependent methyltransferase
MSRSAPFRPFWLVCLLTVAAPHAVGQTTVETTEYEPEVGQQGKDVVWVPTHPAMVEKMLNMAQVTARDVVFDLGSGDGRLVIAAAGRGAEAWGFEYNPRMVELSRRAAQAAGMAERARFVQGDLFTADLKRATVVTMFLLPELNVRLRPKLLQLEPGTRIVSNSFDMDEWQADESAEVSDCDIYCVAYLWIVPARVAGTWQLPDGRLSLTQRFQMVSGTYTSGGANVPIQEARLRGDRLQFRAGEERFVGRVLGDRIEGTRRFAERNADWSAWRIEPARAAAAEPEPAAQAQP